MLLLLFLSSCSADSEYNSTHRCYLYIDNSTRLDPVLNSCMDVMASGTFGRIWLGVENGARKFFIETSDNKSSRITFLAEDRQRTQALGVYNETGLIVGYNNDAISPVFYAYDAVCPNCYESNAPNRYQPLQFKGAPYGHCKCANCGRQYNLNIGGITGDGRPLYRYHADPPRVNGCLKVYN